ncbi:trehalase family glycosidase [Microbacterium sp. KUDC0406]|uniref:trehalase family glycosidase n=1 Tax=Microbacterium sp. KUDC0406 TaxID=2909588 RepID=UPI0022A797D9|nr:trehalase family glycosidase [Microbacterium sp. KUDC0406]
MSRDVSAGPEADPLSPADRYQELFTAVQKGRVFADSKTFVDCVPTGDPRTILSAYRRENKKAGFQLDRFVHEHFELPDLPAAGFTAIHGETMVDHIRRLWNVLLREPAPPRGGGSLLPLEHPYVVPGGRFRELYYWDSYFTMLGLAARGLTDLVKGMTDNFADLIDSYGHVPNANRSYYSSRSQPPLFVFMVHLCVGIGATTGRSTTTSCGRSTAGGWMVSTI